LSLIEEEDKARRLAHAIMADITLYNSDRLAHAMDPERDLAEQLEEGRQLFQSRVAPGLHAVFEDGVRKWASEARARATPGAPPPPSPPPRRETPVVDPVREDQDRRNAEVMESAQRTRMVMILMVVLIAVAGLTFALVSHERQHDAPDKHEGHR
jgi:hypothetical protein